MRICIRELFLIVSEEAVQVSTGESRTSYIKTTVERKGKDHAGIYIKL